MKITITKRQEYVNDEAKEAEYELLMSEHITIIETTSNSTSYFYSTKRLTLNSEQLVALRDELNKLKLDK